MPHNPINYSKTIMYKLCCNDVNIKDVYVGHTTDFITRKAGHKCNCNNEKRKDYNIYVYKFIRENGGWSNWNMVMLEEYPCNSKLEATKRERELMEELNSTLNKVIPTRTYKEYCNDTLNYQSKRHKEYRENNLDKIKELNKKWRKDNEDKLKEKIICNCGSHYSYSSKTTHFKTKKHQNYINSITE